MPGSTANGILSSGNQIKTRSSVVCETRMERVELLVVKRSLVALFILQ